MRKASNVDRSNGPHDGGWIDAGWQLLLKCPPFGIGRRVVLQVSNGVQVHKATESVGVLSPQRGHLTTCGGVADQDGAFDLQARERLK